MPLTGLVSGPFPFTLTIRSLLRDGIHVVVVTLSASFINMTNIDESLSHEALKAVHLLSVTVKSSQGLGQSIILLSPPPIIFQVVPNQHNVNPAFTYEPDAVIVLELSVNF